MGEPSMILRQAQRERLLEEALAYVRLALVETIERKPGRARSNLTRALLLLVDLQEDLGEELPEGTGPYGF